MMKVIQEVLGNPKKKENLLDPTDRLWLLNHTSYKVPQKSKWQFVKLYHLKFTFGSQSVSGYLDLISLQEEELDKMYKAFSADYPRGGMFRT